MSTVDWYNSALAASIHLNTNPQEQDGAKAESDYAAEAVLCFVARPGMSDTDPGGFGLYAFAVGAG